MMKKMVEVKEDLAMVFFFLLLDGFCLFWLWEYLTKCTEEGKDNCFLICMFILIFVFSAGVGFCFGKIKEKFNQKG